MARQIPTRTILMSLIIATLGLGCGDAASESDYTPTPEVEVTKPIKEPTEEPEVTPEEDEDIDAEDAESAPDIPIPCSNLCLGWLMKTNERVDVYEFRGEITFMATPGCCDMTTNVYTSRCEYICAPDGGIGGGGMGDCPDDWNEATYLFPIASPEAYDEQCAQDIR